MIKIGGKEVSLKSIEEGFKNHLNSKADNDKGEKKPQYDSNKSLISNAAKNCEEFENYLVDTAGLEESELSQSTDEVIDGIGQKLESKNDDKKDSTEEKEDDDSFIVGVLSEAITDEKVIETLDEDKDGKLSKDEVASFVKTIDRIEDDETPDELTVEELVKGLDAILEDRYDELKEEAEKNIEKDNTTEEYETDIDNSGSSVGGSGYSGPVSGGSYSGGNYNAGGSSPVNTTTGTDASEPKTAADILKDLKNNVLPEKETDVKNAKDEYKLIQNDGGKVKEYKDGMENAFKNYTDSVNNANEQLANAIRSKKNQIEEQEKLISQKEVDIAEQECNILNLETTYKNLCSRRASLLECKTNLENLLKTDISDKKKEAIRKDLKILEQRIAELDDKISETKENLDNARKQLSEMKSGGDNSLETLKAALRELKGDGEGQMGDLESQINDLLGTHPEIKELLENYHKQEDLYESQKLSLSKDAKAKLEAAQEALNKVNLDIGEKEIEQETKDFAVKKYTQGDLFDADMEVKMEQVKKDGLLPYLLIGPEDVDPDEELPVLIYLHGSGSVGKGFGALMSAGPGKLMNNWDLKNFRGYVICPSLSSGSWNTPNAEAKLRDIYNDFCSTHNVDKDRVAVAGHSLGGQGALYMANAMSDVFSKAVSLSPYVPGNAKDGINIPTRVYVGTNDDSHCVNYSKGALTQMLGSDNIIFLKGGHGAVPIYAFSTDLDGDGCCDMFEWLFGEE